MNTTFGKNTLHSNIIFFQKYLQKALSTQFIPTLYCSKIQCLIGNKYLCGASAVVNLCNLLLADQESYFLDTSKASSLSTLPDSQGRCWSWATNSSLRNEHYNTW